MRWNPTTLSSGAETARSKPSSSMRTKPLPGSDGPSKDLRTTSRSDKPPSSSASNPSMELPTGKKDSRSHVYRVGKLRIPLRQGGEIKSGPKGQFVRRLKEILRKTSTIPKKSLSDGDVHEPPHRPISPRSSLPSSRPGFDNIRRIDSSTIRDTDDDDCDD